MQKTERIKYEIASLKKKLRTKDSCAENNLAAIYRELGNRKRAFFWWKRAVETWGDGDSLLEMGYCYQYGIGISLNKGKATQSYWKAILSNNCTEYGREEAKYHLAIALLDTGKNSISKRTVKKLLKEAAADGDFPQAAGLLQQLEGNVQSPPCRCRRGLLRSLGGANQCRLHGPRKQRRIPKHK